MKPLLTEEREFFEGLLNYGRIEIRNGRRYITTSEKKHYKFSRVLIQLFKNINLEVWEVVHHKDGNPLNDSLNNLAIMDVGEHSSLHNAGKRINPKKIK